MNKIKNLFVAIAIVITLVIIDATPVLAAPAPKLNKTTVNMSTADSVTLKVLNTSNKVKWSSSNPDVARVSSTGKVTPSWFGKTIISAKVNDTVLKCTVNVLDETVWNIEDDLTYSVSIMPISKDRVRVKLWYDDGSDKFISSGSLYGKYEEGAIVFVYQGKYNISGALQVVEYGGDDFCVLVVLESDLDVFLTDGLFFDTFIENS